MPLQYRARGFRKILVPIIAENDCEAALAAARLIAGPDGKIVLVGVVGIPKGVSLSMATSLAREVRKKIRSQSEDERVQVRERVRVSYDPWS